MTNLERLQMEIQGVDNFTTDQLKIYLQENSLVDTEDYVPASNINKKNILKTALSILESIANNPTLMREVKNDDMTISQFSENLQNRIDSLDRKIRLIPSDDSQLADGGFFTYMFK